MDMAPPNVEPMLPASTLVKPQLAEVPKAPNSDEPMFSRPPAPPPPPAPPAMAPVPVRPPPMPIRLARRLSMMGLAKAFHIKSSRPVLMDFHSCLTVLSKPFSMLMNAPWAAFMKPSHMSLFRRRVSAPEIASDS